MKEIIQKVLIIAFSVGLTVSFLFGSTGLKNDAETIKNTTQTKLQNSNTQLTNP
jgi:hypothetical protein